MQALLIGRNYRLAWVLPQMLSRAGFCVDVISSSKLMKHSKFVRHCDLIPPHQSLIPTIVQRMKRDYDWIVVTEDITLAEILESNLSLEEKLKLLPVQAQENFSHLFSKIGLSKLFSSKGVSTPPFFVARHLEEAVSAADELGYPVLLKQDSSGGGNGVFECDCPDDLHSINPQIFDTPLLVQKKISGIEIDLSALYLEGELIHFNYAKVEKVCWNKFGPSILRTYSHLSVVDEQIFQEIAHIGKVLGAHGFTNIGAIQSDGRRFYFEVDMRPNAWVETSRFLGEDPAVPIRNWFSRKEKLHYPVLATKDHPSQLLIPYFLRLGPLELLFNRYRVWKFIPRDDLKFVFTLIFVEHVLLRLRRFLAFFIKLLLPEKHYTNLRNFIMSLWTKTRAFN